MNGSEVSLARAIRGPITLITVGVLFALNNFTRYQFHETWPVLLIVFGLLSLLGRSSEPPRPPMPPGPPAPGKWQPPPATLDSGSYRQSQYPGAQPPPPAGGAA